jgi:hypothetical protein
MYTFFYHDTMNGVSSDFEWVQGETVLNFYESQYPFTIEDYDALLEQIANTDAVEYARMDYP